MEKILILEDDTNLNNGIKLALGQTNYNFFQCKKISEAEEILQQESINLMLLDLNLPDGYGLDFLYSIRKVHRSLPIIIITANDMESDIILGLEIGANDYITKPFSLMVLRARVAVQLRQNKVQRFFEIDNMKFNFDSMNFSVDGQAIDLSKTEQRILFLLLNSHGATLQRSYLIDEVWHGDTDFVENHALTVAIKRLRHKIGDSASTPKYIKTIYGLGYTWGG